MVPSIPSDLRGEVSCAIACRSLADHDGTTENPRRVNISSQETGGQTILEDLKGKRVALGSRNSAQAGLPPYYFLKQHGLDPQRDLAACTFTEDREPSALSDERTVDVGMARRGDREG